jgi:hypothetical protein
MKMRAEELLVLKHDDLSRRTEALYKELSRSRAYRELFVSNPGGVIANTILTGYRNLSSTQINHGNRLFFSLLSNTNFMRWADDYRERVYDQARGILQEAADPIERAALLATTLDKPTIYRDIAEAMLQFADVELMYSLFNINISTVAVLEASEFETGYVIPGPEDGGNVFAIPVFVVIIAIAILAIAFGPPGYLAETFGLSREDFLAVSGFLTERLAARAQELRDGGVLTSVNPAATGSVL